MSILTSRIYYIDSEERITGTSSKFSYLIEIPEGEKFDRVVVLAMTIPLSYYLIRSPHNTFTLDEGGATAIITVPEGNYSATLSPAGGLSKQFCASVLFTLDKTIQCAEPCTDRLAEPLTEPFASLMASHQMVLSSLERPRAPERMVLFIP
jgi:hypothetical protein